MVSQLLFSNYVWQEMDLEMDIISISIQLLHQNFINYLFIKLKRVASLQAMASICICHFISHLLGISVKFLILFLQFSDITQPYTRLFLIYKVIMLLGHHIKWQLGRPVICLFWSWSSFSSFYISETLRSKFVINFDFGFVFQKYLSFYFCSTSLHKVFFLQALNCTHMALHQLISYI